jgi:hypothetical protein
MDARSDVQRSTINLPGAPDRHFCTSERAPYPYPEAADGLAGRPRHHAGNREVSRKVRAPQDEVVGNTHPGQPAGSVPQRTDRPAATRRGGARVKRWCKRPPARRATVVARQTPPGARPDSERSRVVRPSSWVGRWSSPATVSVDGWSPTGSSQGDSANRTRPMSQPVRTRGVPPRRRTCECRWPVASGAHRSREEHSHVRVAWGSHRHDRRRMRRRCAAPRACPPPKNMRMSRAVWMERSHAAALTFACWCRRDRANATAARRIDWTYVGLNITIAQLTRITCQPSRVKAL